MTHIVLIAVITLIASFMITVAMRPDEFRVSRSRVMKAQAADIFRHVSDLRLWNAWSPWAKMDPGAKVEFSGPEEGEGASMRWLGKKTGEGSMTIIDIRVPERIIFRLEFIKPMRATNVAEFTFTSEDNGSTRVTWSMTGRNKFMGKLMSLLVNCEKMVGRQFEQGLADLEMQVGVGA